MTFSVPYISLRCPPTAFERLNWCFSKRRIEFPAQPRGVWPTVVLIYDVSSERTRCVDRSIPEISSRPTDINLQVPTRRMFEVLPSPPRERRQHWHVPIEVWYVHRCSVLLYHPRVRSVQAIERRDSSIYLGWIVGDCIENEDLSPFRTFIQRCQQLVDRRSIQIENFRLRRLFSDLAQCSHGIGHDLNYRMNTELHLKRRVTIGLESESRSRNISRKPWSSTSCWLIS